MDRFLTDEQQLFIEETRRIAREKLLSLVETGPEGRVNRLLIKALAEYGLLPRLFPKHLGGSREGDVSAMELCLMREALARESTEAETALAMQALGAYPILQAGSDVVVKRWIPAVAQGEAVPAFALTEPEAGSDAAGLELKAEPDGNGFRLTGVKTWISNAPDADVYTVFGRTTANARARGVTAFVVPGNSDRVSGTPLHLVAPHPVGRLELDGVFVPSDHVLGEVDGGFRVAMDTLNLFRPSVGAFAVGMSWAALDAATVYALYRRSFGKPLREFQAVSHLLAEMATRTEAARLMVYAAAGAYDSGAASVTKTSAMAKLFATETAQFVVDSAVQINGAAGLERGHLLEHLYREVRAPRIYEGTSEIQREIIARELYR